VLAVSLFARIIGLGNEYRCDDGVGFVVVRRLQAQLTLYQQGIEMLCCDDETRLLDLWKDVAHVIMIDAASFGAVAGTIMRFDLLTQPLPASFESISTHTVGLREVLGIAHILYSLPDSLVLYAIEGKEYAAGITLSPEVTRAVDEVVQRVQAELQAYAC
jgi:hydrogenase maturation protease